MNILNKIFAKKPPIKIFLRAKHLGNKTFQIESKEGTSLMDAINNACLDNIAVFGVCDKQLSCHSCAVNIRSHLDKIPSPSEEESDVIDELKNKDKENSTRMSCQIVLTPDLEGIVVEVNEAAFLSGLSNKDKLDSDDE
mmetsp:Transcript_15571/g.16162  ORF Transcript_15571/g.16162 Transcript_15571/m.16162 type:complete len:139 (+) Transcript_15571:18-434(+)